MLCTNMELTVKQSWAEANVRMKDEYTSFRNIKYRCLLQRYHLCYFHPWKYTRFYLMNEENIVFCSVAMKHFRSLFDLPN